MNPQTIWISRPQKRAAGLVQALANIGLAAHCLPALSIADVTISESHKQIANANYDLIILVSAEAANRFAALRHAPFDALAIGTNTATALHNIANANLLCTPPEVGDSQQLLAQPILQSVQHSRILIVGGESTRMGIAPKLCAGLQSRNAHITTLSVYQRTMPTRTAAAVKNLCTMNVVAATAYSGETANNMLAMLAAAQPQAATHLAQVPLFVIHKNIAAAAKQCGWKNPQLAPANDTQMAQAIHDYLRLTNHS